MKPLGVDLYAGLGGWTDGLLAEGYYVVGFDIEQHIYGEHRYPGQLVLQDVRTIHGRQFKDAALIVASPPCQRFSYMAMPWTRAKDQARAICADNTGESLRQLTELFDACFRIQREACEAAGHHIPMIVENVRGAQEWVGRSRWSFGSFHLWGDVPALMPMAKAIKNTGGSWFNIAHNTTSGCGNNPDGRKTSGHLNQRDGHPHTPHLTNPAEHNFVPQRQLIDSGLKVGGDWFSDPKSPSRMTSSKSQARKRASAQAP